MEPPQEPCPFSAFLADGVLEKLAAAQPVFDFARQSQQIQDAAIQAIQSIFPVQGRTRTLVLNRIWAEDKLADDDYAAQKEAKLRGGTWETPVYASVTLVDNQTRRAVDSAPRLKLLGIPKWTHRYGFIVDGNEYQITNQLRLKSGAYSTITQDQLYQTQINTEKGHNFILILNPKTQLFTLVPSTSTANVKLYSALRYLGIPEEDLRRAWGPQVFDVNRTASVGTFDTEIQKLHKAMFGDVADSNATATQTIQNFFKEKTKISPETTKVALGQPHDRVSAQLFLDASKSLLAIARGQREPDDRQSLANKEIHAVDSFLHQSLLDRAAKLKARLANNIERRDDIRTMISPQQLSEPIYSFFSKSSLANVPKQTNPLSILSDQFKVTVMGEGGIKSERAVPEALRQVHPSHMGILDPLQTPEGGTVGTTVGLTMAVSKRGTDLVQRLINLKTGQREDLTAVQIQDKVVAFPGEFELKDGRWAPRTPIIRAMYRNQEQMLPAGQATHILPDAKFMFGFASNLIPFLNANSGGRALFAGKHMEQAMSLTTREPALVQTVAAPGLTFSKALGKESAITSRVTGTILRVTPDHIDIKDSAGQAHRHGIYNHFPLNQKSMLHSEPLVKPGDTVRPGQVIADSNFTRGGQLALGVNMRVAYLPYPGFSFEDGVVISESAAKRLTSIHIYRYEIDLNENSLLDAKAFSFKYPNVFSLEQMAKLDAQGVVRSGQRVVRGDPLIAKLTKEISTPEDKIITRLRRGAVEVYKNRAVTWEEQVDGEIKDVLKLPKKIVVVVKTEEPANIADKLSNRHGAKGVITRIIPDHEMPRLATTGEPTEILLNPNGVPGRMNVGQLLENTAAKIARKTGQPYLVENFKDDNLLKKVQDDAKKAGVTDKEDLIDPVTGKRIPQVQVGYNYTLKLDHPVRSKFSARHLGPYNDDLTPTQGDQQGGQAVDALTFYGLLAHGAKANLREMATIKSQKNIDFWRAFQTGKPLPKPTTTHVFNKITDTLKAAGVNVDKRGSVLSLMPLTDKHVEQMSSGEVKNPLVVRAKDLMPEKGGLFDPIVTGGLAGCFHYNTMIFTDRGNLRIGDIVTKRLPVRVLSYNKDAGTLEYRKVTTFWTNAESPGLISLNYGSSGVFSGYARRYGPEVLWCTPEHTIYSEDFEKVEAQTLDGRAIYLASHTLSTDQRQVLLGSLLGDGWIDDRRTIHGTGSAMFCERHCAAQKDYLTFKAQVLRFWLSPLGVHREQPLEDGMSRQDRWAFHTIQHEVFSELRDLFYEPLGRKHVTREILDQVHESALAIWCMDDGCGWFQPDGNKRKFILATNSFNGVEIDLLVSWFLERWALRCVKRRQCKKYGARDLGWVLDFQAHSMDQLVELIRPYVHPSMAYKFYRTPYCKPCRICGRGVDPRFDYCDACLLTSLEATGFPGWRGYDCHPARVGDSSNIRRRFGSWAKALAAAWEPPAAGAPKQPSVFGEGLPHLLDVKEPPRVLRRARVRSVDTSGTRHYAWVGTSYDLEVEGTHNYFANGILVGNSKWGHVQLAEPLPHPTFEEPVKTLTGLKQDQYNRVLAGQLYLDPATGQLTEQRTGITAGRAIQGLLQRVNVDQRIQELRQRLPTMTGAALNQGHKELRYLLALKETGSSPTDYVVTKIPVIPPTLRPSYPDPKGNLRHSSLTLLYRDLLMANQDLKDLAKLPDTEKTDVRKALYQSFDALAGLGAEPISPQGKNKWKGVVQQIAGEPQPKFGLLQSKLLRRRQDLSGRSTVAVDPHLGIDEIGLPEDMAWDIMRPHIVRELVTRGKTILTAQEEIDKRTPEAKGALHYVVTKTPVLMNRAPSLHKYSIMAFQPKLVTGQALRVPPLVTKGMSMDFDGDTAAIHTPVTPAAIREAYKLMPSNNLFSPAAGQLMTIPDHESVLGLYHLTSPGRVTGKAYSTEAAAIAELEAGKLHPEDVVTVAGVRTTPGKLLINRELPQEYREHERVWNKKNMADVLTRLGRSHPAQFPLIVNKLKDLGNHYAYHRGVTIGLSDFIVANPVRDKLFQQADQQAARVLGSALPKPQKDEKIVQIYQKVDDALQQHQSGLLEKQDSQLFHTMQAGVRGSKDQVKQIAMAPVLFSSVQNKPLPTPVRRSYIEGLSPAEYWTSMYGARKGVIDRSKETSRPGALQKAMLRTAVNSVITMHDCGTQNGVDVSVGDSLAFKDAAGHYLAADVPGVAPRNTLVTSATLTGIKNRRLLIFKIRSPLTCEATQGLCQLCYGQAIDKNAMPPIGENVGAVAAHSIGEPATQLIMRTMHLGGISSAVAGITSQFDRMNELLEVPKNLPFAATISKVDGTVNRIEPTGAGGHRIWVGPESHIVLPGRALLVKPGDRVRQAHKLSAGEINPHELLQLQGLQPTRQHISRELHKLYHDSGIPIRKVHADVISRALSEHTLVRDPKDHPEFVPGDIAPAVQVDAWNQKKKDPIKHEPLLTGISFVPLRTSDWLDRMAARGLRDTLITGSAQHWRTTVDGIKPIPTWLYGAHFGEHEPGGLY